MHISFPSYYGLYFMGGIALLFLIIYLIWGREGFSPRGAGEEFTLWQGEVTRKRVGEEEEEEWELPAKRKVDFERMKLQNNSPTTETEQAEVPPLEDFTIANEPEEIATPETRPEDILAETLVMPRTMKKDGMAEFAAEPEGGENLHETKIMPREAPELPKGATPAAPIIIPAQASVTEPRPAFREGPGPQPFGFKMCWLAVSGADQMEVMHALGLNKIREAGWQEGMAIAYGEGGSHEVFVTPPANDWILVIGRALWNKLDLNCSLEENAWYNGLLQQLNEVHYYSTQRVVENHAWVKGKKGHIVRGYGYCGELGEVMWSVGEPTAQEQLLGGNFYTPENQGSHDPSLRYPDERDVLLLAALWSVNTSFENVKVGAGPGYIGTLPE